MLWKLPHIAFVLLIAGCGKADEEKVLYSITSPDSNWIVDVTEYYHNGSFSTAESYELEVVKIRPQRGAERPTIIFSMDSNGNNETRPAVLWDSNKKLSITVASGSSIEHWSTWFRGIQVDVVLH